MNSVNMETISKLFGHASSRPPSVTYLSDQSVSDATNHVSGHIYATPAGRGTEREGGVNHAHR